MLYNICCENKVLTKSAVADRYEVAGIYFKVRSAVKICDFANGVRFL